MSGAKKAFLLFLLGVAALGAAFGGGFYVDMLKRQAVERQLADAKTKATQADEQAVKLLATSRARTQLLEATLGVEHQNFGMAFDRLIRTQALVRRIGRSFDKEFDQLNTLLMEQKPEAMFKLVELAERIEPAPGLTLPKSAVPAPPGAAAPKGAAATANQPREASAEHLFQEGREALRQAKELLLTGSESGEIARKLAHAQVLLDDSGYTQLDEELGSAIKAAKSHDDPKLRAALEASLNQLRTP